MHSERLTQANMKLSKGSCHYSSISRYHPRRLVQLKALYRNNAKFVPTEQTYVTMGMYLLYLLATDRIADFHTELEAISSHEQKNAYIRYPITLERYMMEGNYAKVLVEKREPVFEVLFMKLQEAVRTRQQETRELSSINSAKTNLTTLTAESAPLSIISNMVGYAVDLERIV